LITVEIRGYYKRNATQTDTKHLMDLNPSGVISSGDLRKYAAEYTKKREESFDEWRRAAGIYVSKAR
jgi:hypothetical protein